jgi:hypothetical protein
MRPIDSSLDCHLCEASLTDIDPETGKESACMILRSLCIDGSNYMLHYECYLDHVLRQLEGGDTVSCPNPNCDKTQHALDVNKDDPKRGPINFMGK